AAVYSGGPTGVQLQSFSLPQENTLENGFCQRESTLSRCNTRQKNFAAPENKMRVGCNTHTERMNCPRRLYVNCKFLRHIYLAVVASTFFVVTMCHAQITSATVTGVVTDSSGAVVAGTAVSITNVSTGIVSKAVTNNQGLYRISGLIPGVYRENISKQGFKSEVKDGIELHAEDEIALNFALEVGSVSESVTVE